MKNIRKIFASFLVFAGVISVASATGLTGDFVGNMLQINADEQATNVGINSSVTDSSSFSNVNYSYNQYATFNFTHVKKSDTATVGTIKAYSTISKAEVSNGLSSVIVSFDGGSLSIQTWYNEGDLVKRNYELTSGVEKSIDGNYFRITAGSTDVNINSIEINSNCYTPVSKPATSTGIKTFDSVSLEEDLTHKEHYWVLHGQLQSANTFLQDNMEIFDGARKLTITDIYINENQTYSVRCNIFASAASLGTATFYPHMRFGTTNVNIYSNGDIKATYSNDPVNTYGRNTYTTKISYEMPTLTIAPIQSKFYHDSSAVGVSLPFGTSVSWDTKRADPKDGTFYWYYRVCLIQANKYYNFDPNNDKNAVEFYDWHTINNEKGTLHCPPIDKCAIFETTWIDGEKYELICFYVNIYNIVKSKWINKVNTFRGDEYDTVLFKYSCRIAKNGASKETMASDAANNDINLAVDNAKSSSWSLVQDLPNKSSPFYCPGENVDGYKGYMFAHIISLSGRAGFGMYADAAEKAIVGK